MRAKEKTYFKSIKDLFTEDNIEDTVSSAVFYRKKMMKYYYEGLDL